MTLSPDGARLFAVNSSSDIISVVDDDDYGLAV